MSLRPTEDATHTLLREMRDLEARVAQLERRIGPVMTPERLAEIRVEVATEWGREPPP